MFNHLWLLIEVKLNLISNLRKAEKYLGKKEEGEEGEELGEEKQPLFKIPESEGLIIIMCISRTL